MSRYMHGAGAIRRALIVAALSALALLGGCVSYSADSGIGEARALARDQFGADAVWARTDEERAALASEVSGLLAGPLTADSAVRVALLNNPGLQATYARLGIAEADLVQAGRLRNPLLSWVDVSNSGGDRKNERAILFDFWSLLTMPLAIHMEERRFKAVQAMVAQEVGRVALAARTAYIDALATRQQARLIAEFVDSARAGRDLAQRMAQVGNAPQLLAMRHQLLLAETLTRLAGAKKTEQATREQLARILGLETSPRQLRLADSLPELPESVAPGDELEAIAMTRRFDVAAARFGLEGTAQALGLTKANRFVSLLELGPARIREGDSAWMKGYEIQLSVPLFDWGDAKVAKAQALYMEAASRAAQVAVDARSDVRESYYEYRSAYDIAKHLRDEVLPLRRQINEEQLRRYNGMLIGVFDLIADARALIDTASAAVGAQRDFWIADTRMQAAMLGTGSLGASAAVTQIQGSERASAAGGH
jgi:outer membrane protein TolC